MGWYVNTLVTFKAEGEEVSLAAHRLLVGNLGVLEHEWSIEARTVLKAVAEKRGYTNGPKGGLWAVAFTGNCTKGKDLAEELLPFFRALWGDCKMTSSGLLTQGGPMLWSHHAVIVTQDEQTETSKMLVVRYPGIVEERVGPALWHDD